MQPLFPRWSNDVVRLAIALGLCAAVAAPAAAMVWVRTPYVTGQFQPLDQPVQFDHRHHARDDGISCEYCHYTARRAPTAGIPPAALCMNCHSQIWNDSPLLAPVRAAYFRGEPLRWQRVNSLPDHVFFNHAIHVNRGVGCVSCHGRVDQMAMVYQAMPLTMQWCLGCHRDPEPRLRPLAAVTDMAWRPAGDARAVGHAVRTELGVNPPTNCTACHR